MIERRINKNKKSTVNSRKPNGAKLFGDKQIADIKSKLIGSLIFSLYIFASKQLCKPRRP